MSHWPILPPLSIIHLGVHCSHHVSAPLSSTWLQTLTCFTKHCPSLVMWTNSNNTLEHFSHVNVIHILGRRRWKVYNYFWEFDILINYIIIFKLPRSYGMDVFKNSSWSRQLILFPKLIILVPLLSWCHQKKRNWLLIRCFPFWQRWTIVMLAPPPWILVARKYTPSHTTSKISCTCDLVRLGKPLDN